MIHNNDKAPGLVPASTTGTLVVFHAEGLTKVQQMGEVRMHALRGVDLDLYDRGLVVLLGPSGSGKSTPPNILGRLDLATSGTVYDLGHNLVKTTERELTKCRRHHVGFVFQFYNLIPSLTALENVAMVTEIAGNPIKPEDGLALVGLSERDNHLSAQRPGGGQQGDAITRAIAKNPDVLLCDKHDWRTGFQDRHRSNGSAAMRQTGTGHQHRICHA